MPLFLPALFSKANDSVHRTRSNLNDETETKRERTSETLEARANQNFRK